MFLKKELTGYSCTRKLKMRYRQLKCLMKEFTTSP